MIPELNRYAVQSLAFCELRLLFVDGEFLVKHTYNFQLDWYTFIHSFHRLL